MGAISNAACLAILGNWVTLGETNGTTQKIKR